MLGALLVKFISTAVVVIGVSVAVVRLSPKLGGVLAGTPIVLGPGYFFMLREQPSAFVAGAALGSLHAMLATLAFCLSYVLLAGRWGPLTSVALAAALWVPAAAAAAMLPGGVALALSVIAISMILALRLVNSLGLVRGAVSAPIHWSDLIIRGTFAGMIVCLATMALDGFVPSASGVVLSFPIGMITIALTLHQRYGAGAARATLANTLIGMFSLVAFSAVLASSVESMATEFVFGLSLVASILVSMLLWFRHRVECFR